MARAFGRSDRSVRRYQRRFEDGGLAALGRPGGYPSGRPRTDRAQTRLIGRLRGEGKSLRQIADVVGVSEKAIRKQLRRLGWPAAKVVQAELPLPAPAADPNLSGSAAPGDDAVATPAPAADPNLSGSAAPGDEAVAAPAPGADPNLSGSARPGDEAVAAPAPAADPNLSGAPETAEDELLAVSADRDPADRWLDRLFAKLGLLDDAAPLFRDGEHVPRAGVLLALPAIAQSGVVDTAREVYGSIGPAFDEPGVQAVGRHVSGCRLRRRTRRPVCAALPPCRDPRRIWRDKHRLDTDRPDPPPSRSRRKRA